jgi:hypothetical protein
LTGVFVADTVPPGIVQCASLAGFHFQEALQVTPRLFHILTGDFQAFSAGLQENPFQLNNEYFKFDMIYFLFSAIGCWIIVFR